jgi:hypothetical protein
MQSVSRGHDDGATTVNVLSIGFAQSRTINAVGSLS